MSKKLALTLAATLAVAGFIAPFQAQAKDVTVTFAKPLNSDTIKITVTANGQSQEITADIKDTDSAEKKRKKMREALEKKGYRTLESTSATAGPQLTIFSIPKGASVTFDPGKTGETADQISSNAAASAQVSFNGFYSAFGFDGEVASFTAGVVSDKGQAVIEYRPADAKPGDLIDGSYIAQVLFESLLDASADLGAELFLDGATIHVTFDSPSHDGEAGVVFGTSSDGELSASVDLNNLEDSDQSAP